MAVPFLSIIVPVFNVEAFLSECLDSILAQGVSSSEVEVIIVNDGSTDRSGEILAEYDAAHPNFFHIYTIPNGGVSHARNFGASKAHGTFLWFVDSDDVLAPGAFKALLPLVKTTNCDLLLFGHATFQSGAVSNAAEALPNPVLTPHPPAFFPQTLTELSTAKIDGDFSTVSRLDLSAFPPELAHCTPYPWDKWIRRTLFLQNPFPEGMRFEDLPVSMMAAASASEILVVPDCLYRYRLDAGFLGKLTDGALDILPALSHLKKSMEQQDLLNTYGNVLEFLAIKHCFLRFRQIIWNYDRPTRDLKERIVTQCFAYLDTEFPSWKQNPLLPDYLAGFLMQRWNLFSSQKKMLRLVRLCSDRPAFFQKLYVKLFSKK